MRKSRRPIVIASRRSPLAKAQATAVGNFLAKLNPRIAVEYRWIESEADQHLDAPLATQGGKGLFARAIEQAVLKGEADLAVHSLKDLPARPEAGSAGLTIAAVPPRGEVRDCLFAADAAITSIQQIPKGATVGTASPRRTAQLRRLRPDLQVDLLRGNVETRLAKIQEEKRFEATFLAMAGLSRLGLLGRVKVHPLDIQTMLPAASQGALAIQCRSDDHVTISRCLPLNDAATAAAVHAERAIVASLGGDCHSPIAALVQPAGSEVEIRVRVLSPEGRECIETHHTATLKTLGKVVKQVCAELDAKGARTLLHASMPGHGLRNLSRV